jgi:hypothetical protein
VPSGTATPVGYQQLTVSSAAVALTVPAPSGNLPGPNCALIRVSGAGVRYRDDGTNPAAGTGYPLNVGDSIPYYGNLSVLKFIRSGSADATLDIVYYIGDVVSSRRHPAASAATAPPAPRTAGTRSRSAAASTTTQPTLTDGSAATSRSTLAANARSRSSAPSRSVNTSDVTTPADGQCGRAADC